MKESEYFFNQERIHLQVADNPCFDAWIRASNRDYARRCRRSAVEAQGIEALEDQLEALKVASATAPEDETPHPDELVVVQRKIDELRDNQEARYENAR